MVTWQEPPQKRGPIARAREVDAEIVELQKRPGEWALMLAGVNASRRDAYISRGAEVRLAAAERGFDIYARWPAGSDRPGATNTDPPG